MDLAIDCSVGSLAWQGMPNASPLFTLWESIDNDAYLIRDDSHYYGDGRCEPDMAGACQCGCP